MCGVAGIILGSCDVVVRPYLTGLVGFSLLPVVSRLFIIDIVVVKSSNERKRGVSWVSFCNYFNFVGVCACHQDES